MTIQTRDGIRYNVIIPHTELTDNDEAWNAYHEWILDTRHPVMQADKLGRSNPRMWTSQWLKFLCNNPDCAGLAIVHYGDLLNETLDYDPEMRE